MKVYDEVLKQEIEIHESVAPNVGKNLELKDPDHFEELFVKKEDE